MKYLTLILTLMTTSVFAEDIPTYLKDGVITVTLKDGKQYTFSANEYKVVKRKSEVDKLVAELKNIKSEDVEQLKQAQEEVSKLVQVVETKRHKHIVSGELVRSKNGLEVNNGTNEVDIKTKKEIGVGIQYQYNIYRGLYLGGRFDSNGGTGINLGVGF